LALSLEILVDGNIVGVLGPLCTSITIALAKPGLICGSSIQVKNNNGTGSVIISWAIGADEV
jgi:hypothetical protein